MLAAGRWQTEAKLKLKGTRQQAGQASTSSCSITQLLLEGLKGSAVPGHSVCGLSTVGGTLSSEKPPPQLCGLLLLFRSIPLGVHGWAADTAVLMKLPLVNRGAGLEDTGTGLSGLQSIHSPAKETGGSGGLWFRAESGLWGACSRRGSSGEAGSERHLRKMGMGSAKLHCISTAGSGVMGVPGGRGEGGGRLKVREIKDLLGVSKSLILPPLRSCRWEKGLTRCGVSWARGKVGDLGRNMSDWLRERGCSGVKSRWPSRPDGALGKDSCLAV